MIYKMLIRARSGFKHFLLPHMIQQDYAILRLTLLLFLLSVINLLLMALLIRQLPNVLILHSNIYFGIDLIGPWYHALLIPFLGFLIAIIHYIIGVMVYNFDKFLSFLIIGGAVIIQIVFIVSSWFIIRLNI